MPGRIGGTAVLGSGAVALSNIPIPDPSVVTQQAIDRTKNELKEDARALVSGLKTEVDINHRNREQSTAAQALLIAEKFNVIGERFNRVDERFRTIDIVFTERRVQSQEDKAAADKAMLERGAFNAEAVRKSEDGFKARIAALETAIGSTKTNLETSLNDLKDRIIRLETSTLALREIKTDNRLTTGTVVGVAGGVVGVLMLMVASFQLYSSSHGPVPVGSALIGADTKRVDDLIQQQLGQNSAINSRLDALSARMTGAGAPPPRTP